MANFRTRYRDLLKICRRYGVRELPAKRGRGSERIWERVVDGGKLAATVTQHSGAGHKLGVGLVAAVRRRLKRTPADGITDEEFYGKQR